MDGERGRSQRGPGLPIVLVVALTSCSPTTPVESLPPARETLAAAGQRLILSHSAAELTTMARRGDRVLGSLTRAERDALARGYVRFRIERPADVLIAAPRGSVPFWVDDLGFTPTNLEIPRPRAGMGCLPEGL